MTTSEKGTLEAKGIETVRRDTCPIVQKKKKKKKD